MIDVDGPECDACGAYGHETKECRWPPECEPRAPLSLLPCPFCGDASPALDSFDFEEGGGVLHWIRCPECEAEGGPAATPAEACARWNRRAAPPAETAEGKLTPGGGYRVRELTPQHRACEHKMIRGGAAPKCWDCGASAFPR